MWRILLENGVPVKMVNNIWELYKKWVKLKCFLSPLLFNSFEERKGITWRISGRLEDLDYANDLCLLSHTVANMKLKLECLNTKAKRVKLKISLSKAKRLRLMPNNTDEFALNNEVIGMVDQFTYLTSRGGGKGTANHEYKKREKPLACSITSVALKSCLLQQQFVFSIRFSSTNVKPGWLQRTSLRAVKSLSTDV